jgi:hypothetical protein
MLQNDYGFWISIKEKTQIFGHKDLLYNRFNYFAEYFKINKSH